MDESLKALANVVKELSSNVFEDEEVGECIYSALTEESFDDIDDILEDLESYQNCTLTFATCRLGMRIMSEAEKYKLFQLLCHVYRHGVTELSAIENTFHVEQEGDQMIDLVIKCCKQVNQRLETKSLTPIKISNVLRMFRSKPELTSIVLLTMPTTEFCEEAAKFGVPVARSRRILTEFRKSVNHEEASYHDSTGMKMMERRFDWRQGSNVQIYSRSSQKWCNGEIVNVFADSEGEWLRVKYQIGENRKFKSIQRYNRYVRPSVASTHDEGPRESAKSKATLADNQQN